MELDCQTRAPIVVDQVGTSFEADVLDAIRRDLRAELASPDGRRHRHHHGHEHDAEKFPHATQINDDLS